MIIAYRTKLLAVIACISPAVAQSTGVPGPLIAWNSAVAVPSGNYKQVSDGPYAFAAIREGGGLEVWGHNAPGTPTHGYLSSVVTAITSVPDGLVAMIPPATGATNEVVDVSVGYYHMMALLDDGTLFTWGHNNAAQVPYYPWAGLAPLDTGGVPFEFVDIAAGESVSAGVTSDGRIVIWGYDYNGSWESWNGSLSLISSSSQPTACYQGGTVPTSMNVFVTASGLYDGVSCSGHHVLGSLISPTATLVDGWGPAQSTSNGCLGQGCSYGSGKYKQRQYILPLLTNTVPELCAQDAGGIYSNWSEAGVPVQVAAGHNHSVVLFDVGESYPAMFGWGRNAAQSGRGCSTWLVESDLQYYRFIDAGEGTTTFISPNYTYGIFGGTDQTPSNLFTPPSGFAELVSARYVAGLAIQRCYADFNRDGIVDYDSDMVAFGVAFSLGDIATDVNNDGMLDDADVAEFNSLLTAGDCW